jgi:Na+-transporting NADH:ubiquinone oxidoreductase subunit NqrC
MQAALQQNPDLPQYVVPGLAGKMDPATESIAAAEYLYQGAQALQGAGIDNPTVLDVRGYYNFGPANGANIAKADDSETMASVLTGLSASTLTANGISPGETVGQWRTSVSAKFGNSAGQSVLL